MTRKWWKPQFSLKLVLLPGMLKYLRIAITALTIAACVGLVVLWMRSYSGREFLGECVTPEYRYEFRSMNGKLLFSSNSVAAMSS
jgi:hypothetical protein